MNALAIITVISGLLYASLIIALARGWRKLEVFISDNKAETRPGTLASIVIAARNEEDNIAACLLDLLEQDFPADNYEIIVVDDHSEDETALLVQKIMKKHQRVKLIKMADLQDPSAGKKAAIAAGIEQAAGELIITTDADCRFTTQWLSTITAYYMLNQPVMISGPVSFFSRKNIFGKFMELEFMGLVAAGAGAIGLQKPLMCNGANLAFRRAVFFELNAFETNKNWASGDDVFLMHAIREKFGAQAIHFLKSEHAIVKTRAPAGLKEFFMQRKRWGSKTRAYLHTFTATVAGVVFFNALILITATVLAMFHPVLWLPVLFGWGFKFLGDFRLLYPASVFFQSRKLMMWFFPFQLINVAYIVVAALAGIFSGFSWKGRRH